MDFYSRLKQKKADDGLTWGDIGSMIDMKENAIRVAVERQSLSQLEIKELERRLFQKTALPEHGLDARDIKKLAQLVDQNWDALAQDELFLARVNLYCQRQLSGQVAAAGG